MNAFLAHVHPRFSRDYLGAMLATVNSTRHLQLSLKAIF
jgi:hypothetical protein